MTSLRFAATCCGIWLAACGGTEELALNPLAAGAVSQSSSGASFAGTSGSSSAASGTAGNPGGGGAASAGTAGKTFGGGGVAARPCDGDGACVSPAAPHCRADGRCVECVTDANCGGEKSHCDQTSGVCTEVECLNGGSSGGSDDCEEP